jgi:hypothetical protein
MPTTALTGKSVVLDGSNSSDNVGIVDWIWTFEYNGSTMTLMGERPSFVFEIPGKYFVHLKVIDSAGLRDEAIEILEVTDSSKVHGGADGVEWWTTIGGIIAIIVAILVIGIAISRRRRAAAVDLQHGPAIRRDTAQDAKDPSAGGVDTGDTSITNEWEEY